MYNNIIVELKLNLIVKIFQHLNNHLFVVFSSIILTIEIENQNLKTRNNTEVNEIQKKIVLNETKLIF